MEDLDLLGAEWMGSGARREFTVDSKSRGEGTYVLHARGDASGLLPGTGSVLWTPDNIMWDLIAVDPDKRGLTVSKARDDVSFAAWLSGDWSRLYANAPRLEESLAQKAAQQYDAAKTEIKEDLRAAAKAASDAAKAGADAAGTAGTKIAVGFGAAAAAVLVVALVVKR